MNEQTDLPDDEPQILNINLDARKGKVEIAALAPSVVMLAAECTKLLEAHEARNYVQFDLMPRFDSGERWFQVTVQRMDGKSPAQRVTEMEKQVAALEAERDQLREYAACMERDAVECAAHYEQIAPGHNPSLELQLQVQTQAARIAELEAERDEFRAQLAAWETLDGGEHQITPVKTLRIEQYIYQGHEKTVTNTKVLVYRNGKYIGQIVMPDTLRLQRRKDTNHADS